MKKMKKLAWAAIMKFQFDAEAYFRENTTLKSTFDVASSQSIHTESEKHDSF